jgi:hypothetical protein
LLNCKLRSIYEHFKCNFYFFFLRSVQKSQNYYGITCRLDSFSNCHQFAILVLTFAVHFLSVFVHVMEMKGRKRHKNSLWCWWRNAWDDFSFCKLFLLVPTYDVSFFLYAKIFLTQAEFFFIFTFNGFCLCFVYMSCMCRIFAFLRLAVYDSWMMERNILMFRLSYHISFWSFVHIVVHFNCSRHKTRHSQ